MLVVLSAVGAGNQALELGEPVQVSGGLDGVRRHPPKFAFGDSGERAGGRELDDRRHIRLDAWSRCTGPSAPAGSAVRPAWSWRRPPRRPAGRRRWTAACAVGSAVVTPRPRRRSRRWPAPCSAVWNAPAVASCAHPRLLRRILGELVQRGQAAGGHDLAGGVAVGGDQVQRLEAGQHLGLVAAEHRGHAGGLDRARLGHLGAAGGGQRDGVVGGDHAGDRVGGDLADGVAGDDEVRVRRAGRAWSVPRGPAASRPRRAAGSPRCR